MEKEYMKSKAKSERKERGGSSRAATGYPAASENVMVEIGGESVRCHCTCNVFHHPKPTDKTLYECNACGQWYRGEYL
jgi:hypothetical protein